jgi:DNA-binding NarL/FixJ family response regulator
MTKDENPVNVVIADSQFLITESLKIILHADGRFFITEIVTDKDELIAALSHDEIQILIIDPSSSDISVLSELQGIRSKFPKLKILIITNIINRIELQEYNSIGITNIILKTADREELFEALTSVIKGKKFYSDEVLQILFEDNERKKTGEETKQLTTSEIEIVRLISEGLTTKEIAVRKFISHHTVITHRKNIFRKLGVSSISELLMLAIRSGWINMIEYHI